MENDERKSGFEDIPDVFFSYKPCNHREHEPPNMMVVPPGKRYRHVCPGCGQTTYLYPSYQLGLTDGKLECKV